MRRVFSGPRPPECGRLGGDLRPLFGVRVLCCPPRRPRLESRGATDTHSLRGEIRCFRVRGRRFLFRPVFYPYPLAFFYSGIMSWV